MIPDLSKHIRDPIKFQEALWPSYKFFDRQREMVLWVRDSIETHVVAGNELGKDFGAGWIALSFFIAPQLYFDPEYVREVESWRTPKADPHTRRVVTTSVKDEHIDVLWAEIGRFYRTCELSLNDLLQMVTHEIRFRSEANAKNPLSYLKGMVSAKGEGMAGHHAAYTLMIGDEASGLDDQVHKGAQGWAKRFLYFGNPEECQNFWRKACEAGDLLAA